MTVIFDHAERDFARKSDCDLPNDRDYLVCPACPLPLARPSGKRASSRRSHRTSTPDWSYRGVADGIRGADNVGFIGSTARGSHLVFTMDWRCFVGCRAWLHCVVVGAFACKDGDKS